MRNETSKRIIWAMGASISLWICFVLCRYAFFGLHGMREWPFDLFVFGLIVIVTASIFGGRKIMVCTVLGYIIGFTVGMQFGVKGIDEGGGATNNNWILWTITMVIFVLLGIIGEIVMYFKKPVDLK